MCPAFLWETKMTIEIDNRWEALKTERAFVSSCGIFNVLGSNRVPEDDTSFEEGANAIDARIEHIVSNSMMRN